MICSGDHLKDVYKSCLRDEFLVYTKPGKYNCVPDFVIPYFGSRFDALFKKLMASENYKRIINNTFSANLLPSLEIEQSKLCDHESYAFMGTPYNLEETELENIEFGRTLLRINQKMNVVYTVSKADDWYIFKLFFPSESAYWDGHTEETKLTLNLVSVWCVKQLPDIRKFDLVVPGLTTMNDVMDIDPSFRYFEKNEIRYSTHSFADKDGTRISIEYRKDARGIYRVSNIVRVKEGYNLLPYLLPIDRQLVDPNYVPPEDPGCTIM